tara:strand:+ start:7489 stop:7656 length:168 start_codon:yes stop_codon:yes gene_type:complete
MPIAKLANWGKYARDNYKSHAAYKATLANETLCIFLRITTELSVLILILLATLIF